MVVTFIEHVRSSGRTGGWFVVFGPGEEDSWLVDDFREALIVAECLIRGIEPYLDDEWVQVDNHYNVRYTPDGEEIRSGIGIR